jgi:hypothetical protein
MRISKSRKIWFNSVLFEWSNYSKCFGHVQILGTDMSAKMWEVTVEHARTCVIDDKMVTSDGTNYGRPVCSY